MTTTPSPAESSRPSWRRRLSQPALPITRPTLPSISGLRAALLGYIGEVEAAISNRVHGEQIAFDPSPLSMTDTLEVSSPSSISGDETPWASSSTASSSHLTLDGLRNRNGQSAGLQAIPSQSYTESLLEHLSSLREDVTRYLPSRLQVPAVPNPAAFGPTGDWFKGLPGRIRMIDMSVNSPPPPSSPGSPVLKQELEFDQGAVEHARKKVIDLVHALLPSEEWAGWEKLGWEEQDSYPQRKVFGQQSTSNGLGLRMPRGPPIGREEEDDDEEPEYLFPNRTPASAKALSRRRAFRSRSLGAAEFPTLSSPLLAPRLHRTQTEPSAYTVVDDDSDEDGDLDQTELDVFIADNEKGAVLERVVSARALGPSVQDTLKAAEDGKRLVTYEDLPFIWRNNEHILAGYRFIPLHASTGPIPLIKSAFALHNETVNIHSHFIPTLLIFAFIPIMIYSSPLPGAHVLDTATLVVYLLAAAACLISSAGWHVLSGCAAKRWFEWGACVDYIGISWLIAASFFTVLYNAFYCSPWTVVTYSSVNLSCGILGSYLPFQKWFNERRYKNWRISFFLFLCFAMFAPMIQLFYEQGMKQGNRFVAAFAPSGLAYITGLVFYACHFPECVWPGKFDTLGHSHQFWHAGIVIAIVLHYRAIFVAHGMKYEYSCASPDAGQPVAEWIEGRWRTLVERTWG